MSSQAFRFAAASIASIAIVLAPLTPAYAGGGGGGHGPNCHGGGFNFKFININKNLNINKNIDINKNININKNVNIVKNIVIDKSSAVASAEASALAAAGASAGAGATTYYGGSSYENLVVKNGGGTVPIATEERCEYQEATVMKSIHAMCVSPEGREFPATHMTRETWIDSSYEGEVARCIPGAHLRIVIGDVMQSDQGMAGTTEGGGFSCGPHEALRHYKNGMLKCAPATWVSDCTERTNLRRYGTGDLFFSYRSKVCVTPTRTARTEADLGGMSLEGGVGPGY
ncbi:MAG: hypothetical protein JOZ55_03145 [Alphaproteobacteria bacterium]|nr:hypothetical protein [Alphaproteobacteria bacterium]